MNLEKLRAVAEQAKADEMKEAQEKPSMVYISRSEVIKPYFDGYEQALNDVEDNDPAFGIDLLEEIQKVQQKLDEFIDQAVTEAESYDAYDGDIEEMSPDQAYAQGCASAYQQARWRLDKIVNKVKDEQIRINIFKAAEEQEKAK